MFFLCVTNPSFSRIAFGSCNQHDGDQSMWSHIAATKPDAFVFLGDVVYADTRRGPGDFVPSPLELVQAKFDAQV